MILAPTETPPANLHPVEFDFAAASAAETALSSCAGIVDRASRLRAADARAAVVGWTGDQHTAFEADENALSQRASAMVALLRANAVKLRDAAEAARAENARRARALTAWTHQMTTAREAWAKAQAAGAAQPAGR